MTSAIPALLLALLLPWIFGSLLANLLSGARRSFLLDLGEGYILGTLAVVWLIKVWDAADWNLNFWTMSCVLMLLTIFLLVSRMFIRTGDRESFPTSSDRSAYGWQRAAILLLLVAMGAHLFFIMQEVLLRPTFPWDAWRGWEPKAIQFYDNRSLVAPIETVGNYGEVSTHILFWTMLATNSSHEPFLHLPWLFVYVAMAALTYGYLHNRYSNHIATACTYLVFSLAYLNSHVALAGYADIWLTLAFTTGVLALGNFKRHHSYKQLFVVLMMIIACLQSKRAGAGIAAVLSVLAIIHVALKAPRSLQLFLLLLSASGVGFLGLALLGHMDLQISCPGGYDLSFSSTEFRITGLLRFTFEPNWQFTPFLEAIFLFSNWNLAAYVWLVTTAAVLILRKWPLMLQTESLAVLGGLTVISLYFVLISPESAMDHTGLSRALLYIIPLAVIWSLTAINQLLEKE